MRKKRLVERRERMIVGGISYKKSRVCHKTRSAYFFPATRYSTHILFSTPSTFFMNTPSYFLSSEAPSLVHTPGTVSDQDTEYEYSLANSTLMLGDVPRGTSAKQLAKALCEHSNNVLRSEQV